MGIIGYIDNSCIRDLEDRKSITGSVSSLELQSSPGLTKDNKPYQR